MEFWNDPTFRQIVREVLIALFLALLSALGYDHKINKPRIERLQSDIEANRRHHVKHLTERAHPYLRPPPLDDPNGDT